MVCVRSQPGGASSAAATALSVPLAFGSSASAPRAGSTSSTVAADPSTGSHAVEHDVADRQRPGLVQADDVDAGQPLDGRQLLHQDLLPGQRDRREEERHRRQQDEALGHQADEAAGRPDDDGSRQSSVAVRPGTCDQICSGSARTMTQVMYFSSVLTDAWISEWVLVNVLASRGDRVDVGVGADGGARRTARARPPRVVPDRTSSPRLLGHRVRLAGEVRLVDLEPADRDADVRRPAPGRRRAARPGRPSTTSVVAISVIRPSRTTRVVGCVEQGELVELPLGEVLLDDPDGRVDDEDHAEQAVGERPGDQDQHEQRAEDRVEAREARSARTISPSGARRRARSAG